MSLTMCGTARAALLREAEAEAKMGYDGMGRARGMLEGLAFCSGDTVPKTGVRSKKDARCALAGIARQACG